MREIRTLRATWRGLETWHGRDVSARPARQSSTLPERIKRAFPLNPGIGADYVPPLLEVRDLATEVSLTAPSRSRDHPSSARAQVSCLGVISSTMEDSEFIRA